MGIDVIDIVWHETGIGDGIGNAANNRLSIRAGAGAVECIGHLTATLHDTQNLRAARHSRLVAFEDQRARALGHNEAVAVLRKRLGCSVRNVVAGRKGRK